jgi:hypothetical protein
LGERLASRHRYLLPADPKCCVDRLRSPTRADKRWILARDGLSANDPKQSSVVPQFEFFCAADNILV